MTTITEENFKNKENYVELAEAQMEKWREGVAKLDSDIKKLPFEVQAAYGREIDALRTKFERVETAYDEMKQADSKQWQEARYRWGKSAAEYWQVFIASANRLHNEQKVPLEWVREFADESIYQSAGWAESSGEPPQGSKGWVEGIGERPRRSRGGAEGYERLSKF
jgi:hypothetical protein